MKPRSAEYAEKYDKESSEYVAEHEKEHLEYAEKGEKGSTALKALLRAVCAKIDTVASSSASASASSLEEYTGQHIAMACYGLQGLRAEAKVNMALNYTHTHTLNCFFRS